MVFPEYTAIETKIVEDIRHVTAIEGTELTLTFRLNKLVATAKLVDEAGTVIDLKRVEGAEAIYATTMTMVDSHRYKLMLVDADKRSNKLPREINVNVTRNKPATVAITAPGRDVRVSPVEELKLKAKVDDDFGIIHAGLSYSLPAASRRRSRSPILPGRPGTSSPSTCLSSRGSRPPPTSS